MSTSPLADRLVGAYERWLDALKRGDSATVGATVAVAGAGLLALGCVLLAPSDSPAAMTATQRTFAAGVTVSVDGKSVAVERVSPATLSKAADTLAAAHKADPMMVACSRADMTAEQRERALQWLYRTMLKSAVPASYGSLCLQTSNNDAVAVWYPDGIEISLPTLAANGAWQYLCRFSGWERRGRFLGYSEIIRAVKRRVLAGFETSHFYLMTYGLRPSADRASLKAVILPICQRADMMGQPCYVEVSKPSDTALFEELGFKNAADGGETFKLFGTEVTVMKRDPVVASGAGASSK